MSKYTFINENVDYNGQPTETIKLEVEAVHISDILESFERFLRGAGFVFEGQLDFVVEEEYNDAFAKFEEAHDKFKMSMPGTVGGASVVFSNKRCRVCGLTEEQLGLHTCYDSNCGLK